MNSSIFQASASWMLALAATLFCHVASPSGAIAEEPKPNVLGLSHVAIIVADVDRSVAFYKDFLGFAEQGRLNVLGTDTLQLSCLKINDSQWFEVFAGLKPGEKLIHQVAFRYNDAELIKSQLAESGFKTPPTIHKGQMRNCGFCSVDPNGYIIEIVQYLPGSWTFRDAGKLMPDTRISEHLIGEAVTTTDLAATRHFYVDVMGLTEKQGEPKEGKAASCVSFTIPGTNDYIQCDLDPSTVPHFCFEIADADKTKAILESRPYRAQYHRPINITTAANGQRVIDLYDPEGIHVQLMEKSHGLK
jgi:catechol 2,3-dioxygenase-like lactoylglutathione lyase family enzyme